MIYLILICLFIFFICLFIMILASFFSKKSFNDREKNSPFECGFDPKSSSRLPFSLRFFLIAIIFLIFDVEIALLTPMMIIMNYSNLLSWMLMSLFFIFILMIGLFHEWHQGALKWTN